MSRHPIPILTGLASRRAHGVRKELLRRARGARIASRDPDIDERQAASLRGKARAYQEGAELVRALESGRRLGKRFRREGDD